MDINVFKDWLINKLLPNILSNSITVMGNASYHFIEVNKASSLKSDMQLWFCNKSIEFDAQSTKVVLYDLIKLKKKRQFQSLWNK